MSVHLKNCSFCPDLKLKQLVQSLIKLLHGLHYGALQFLEFSFQSLHCKGGTVIKLNYLFLWQGYGEEAHHLLELFPLL